MEYLKFTPELVNDWKNALSASEPYVFKRVMDSMNQSQLESKLWIIQELIKLDIKPKRVAILAGWFAQYIVSLLYDNFDSIVRIENFEIDRDVKKLSYKFNKRYKEEGYAVRIKNVMFNPIWKKQKTELDKEFLIRYFDTIINTSCEHMYSMSKFRELNKLIWKAAEKHPLFLFPAVKKPLYILQSSNDDEYDDHINCVSCPEELIDQARIDNVMYSGTLKLSNGMNRFMVIGR